MKNENLISFLALTMASTVSVVSASYFGYDVPSYRDIPGSSLEWTRKPEVDPLPLCEGIHVGPDTTFSRTIEVDHCLLDCKGNILRGRGLDPVVYVRNGGQLVDCPIEVDKSSTGVVCDNGDCLLLKVSCFGDKNFDECVLVKNKARNVLLLLLKAVNPNGKNGVRAVAAYNANIYLEGSEITHQKRDGVVATQINNLVLNVNEISYNGWDGVDARNIANHVIALDTKFNENGDEGLDVKRAKNTLIAYIEASRNKHNGMEVIAANTAFVHIVDSRFDYNGQGTAATDDANQNGVYIEGPQKVEMAKVYAEYNKGDGFKMNNVHFLTIDESNAGYNEADGFDLRRINGAELYSVAAYHNHLTGVRSFSNGDFSVEGSSNFYENGKDKSQSIKDLSGLFVANTRKAFVSYASSHDNGGYGFFVLNVPDLAFEYSKAVNNGDDGFDIETATEVEIKYDTTSSDNKGNGFSLADISRLYVDENVKAFKNKGRGFDIQGVDHVEIRKTDSFKNSEDGFYVSGSQYLYVDATYGVRNGKDGFFVDNGILHTEVVYGNVVACENGDDGMEFVEGFDDGSFWFTPNNDVFSCNNHQLDLQFDGDIDVSFGPSDIVQEPNGGVQQAEALSFGGVNDITADTCADKNGNEQIAPCKELNILPCDHFVCPNFE